MEKAIDKKAMLNLIIDAKRTDPETGSFADWLAEYLVEHLSTLSRPSNTPLTLDELQDMDAPVWRACKTIKGGNGYWCLCKNGRIMTPSGRLFEARSVSLWTFYRRPPEGEENT